MVFRLLLLLLLPAISSAQVYRIEYRNLTRQVLTSPVCASHSAGTEIFTVGAVASDGLRLLAEDGVDGDYANELRALDGVQRVRVGGFVFGRGTGSLNVRATRKSRWISCNFGMLVATNDGFGAARNIRLPRKKGQSRKFVGRAYDSGTEVNTESCLHVPGGPCDAHFVGIAENGTVQLHQGVLGIADIGRNLAWRRNVIRGTITRIR